jgi:hypothetical protein
MDLLLLPLVLLYKIASLNTNGLTSVMWVRMLTGFVYQQTIEICLLYVTTTLGFVEWWSRKRILLSEKTHSQGQTSWTNRVLRSPVFLKSRQGTEWPHNVITSVSLNYMDRLASQRHFSSQYLG